MEEKLADIHYRKYRDLEGKKVHYSNKCRRIAELIDPNVDVFMSQRTPHTNLLYSGIPKSAVDAFVNNMSSILMGKYPWFFLEFEEGALDESTEAKTWLDDIRNKIYKILSSKYSNFNTAARVVWRDLAMWGNAVVQVLTPRDKQDDELVYFLNIPMSECCFAEDSRQVIETMYRKFKMSASNVLSTFVDIPKDIVSRLQELVQENFNKEVEILHCVYPIEKPMDKEVSLLKKKEEEDYKFYSLYILLDPVGLRSERVILEQRKLKYFPYLIARWDRVYSSVYAESPAMSAEIDIRTLHIVTEAFVARAQFELQPPIKTYNLGDGYIKRKIQPGSVFNLKPGQDISPLELNTSRAFIVSDKILMYYEDQVKRKMYLHLFDQVPNYPEKTATQIRDYRVNSLKQLGPAVNRAYDEFLVPVVESVFNILLDYDMITNYPNVIQDRNIKVEIQTPITNAQNTIALENLSGFAQILSAFVQYYPDLLDALEPYQLLQEMLDGTSVPYEVLIPKEEFDQKIQQKQQMQQLAAAQEQMDASAEANAGAFKDATQGMNNLQKGNGDGSSQSATN